MSPPSPTSIVEHKHWVEQLANQVLSRGPPPYVVSAGMTTSGPTHIGTLCELLYPQAINNYLRREGHPVRYLFSADILDAFDSVPASHAAFVSGLTPHLGKPLCHVPDPQGCCPSLGHHFLNDALEVGKAFGIAPEVVLASDLYCSKEMDGLASLLMARAEQCQRVVSGSSLNPNLPADWSPVMPICQNCGKVATTRVTRLEPDAYAYVCDRDVKYTKGCGHAGHNRLADHRYKLTWRLHWPSWMKHSHTSIEGAGMDHHTKGGSWDTCQAVFREIFGQEPPVGFQFGFVLFQGKKYSKSKGTGMGVRQLLQLLPPPVLAFALLRPDLAENRDLNPTPENLLRLMLEYQEAGVLAQKMGLLGRPNTNSPLPPAGHAVPIVPSTPAGALVHQSGSPSAELSRAERKRALAYALASNREPPWPPDFTDLLIYYGLYHDWDVVAQKLGHAAAIRALASYVEAWAAQGLIPDQYVFHFNPRPATDPAVRDWADRLQPALSALDIHNLVFEVARERQMKAGPLFSAIYLTLLGKPQGPKLGRLVELIGVQAVRDALRAT